MRMLAAARSRSEAAPGGPRLINGHVEALPFVDGAFDHVVAVAVLCFVREVDHALAEMARVLKPGGRLVVGELGRFSLWAAVRRVRGWLCARTWRAARFHTTDELQRLVKRHGLVVRETRGSIYYPPCGPAASFLAPPDFWLGRRTTLGAGFIALSAAKIA
jgi:ubiquinone/menaquinone biosynthesis C-methylase UbiE